MDNFKKHIEIEENEIYLSELLESDKYQSVYSGTFNGKNCFITLPNVPTSWDYSINY